MTDRDPDLDREEIQLPDGRRLVYYRFPDEPGRDGAAPAPGATTAGEGGEAGVPAPGGGG